jgi:DnaK suppressor protein
LPLGPGGGIERSRFHQDQEGNMDVEVFRGLLNSRLAELEANTGARIGSLVDHRDSLSDTSDIATEESDRDLSLRMHDHERVLARQIRNALRRVESGDYGICMTCGDDIAEKRLLAQPTALHCIDCRMELEARGAA